MAGTRPVRLQDVCERTGLSLYTVSLALRGEEGVALETRERVIAAARELGYDVRQMRGPRQPGGMPSRRRPRAAADARIGPAAGGPNGHSAPRATRRAVAPVRRRIAIAYPAARGLASLEREVNYRLYLRGIQRAAQALAVDLVFLPSLDDDSDPLAHFVLGDAHADERADGVILLGFGDESPTVRRALALRPEAPAGQAERAARVVMLNRFAPPMRCSWISVDHTAAATRLTEHLFERGYTRAAFVAERYDRLWQRQRHEGFRTAHARRGVELPPDHELVQDLPPDAAADRLERLIRRARRQKATLAVFVAVDALALQLRDLLAKRGLEAPRDYGLAGYDNTADGRTGTANELTSVGFPREIMGERAVRLIRDLADDESLDQVHVYIAPEFHFRASTGEPERD